MKVVITGNLFEGFALIFPLLLRPRNFDGILESRPDGTADYNGSGSQTWYSLGKNNVRLPSEFPVDSADSLHRLPIGFAATKSSVSSLPNQPNFNSRSYDVGNYFVTMRAYKTRPRRLHR